MTYDTNHRTTNDVVRDCEVRIDRVAEEAEVVHNGAVSRVVPGILTDSKLVVCGRYVDLAPYTIFTTLSWKVFVLPLVTSGRHRRAFALGLRASVLRHTMRDGDQALYNHECGICYE